MAVAKDAEVLQTKTLEVILSNFKKDGCYSEGVLAKQNAVLHDGCCKGC